MFAIFCLITAIGMHLPVGDAINMTYFHKNLVMAAASSTCFPLAPVH